MATIDNRSAYTFDKQPRQILGALRLLCVNTTFLKRYVPILRPEHWTEMEAKWIVREVLAHYDEFGRAPRLQTMRMRLDADTKLKPEQEDLIGRMLNKLDSIEIDDATREYIDKRFEGFIRYRATLVALRQAQEYLQEDDNDAAVEVVQESQKIRLLTDDWHKLPHHADSYFKYFAEENIKKVSVPIGIEPLDKVLRGGLRRGELGVVVASLGVGKSMALVHFGAAAYRAGKKVVHFTMENSWEETMARYMHNLLDIDSDALAKLNPDDEDYNRRAIRMDDMNGLINIKELPSHETSSMDIATYLQRLEEIDEFPDVVLVDYADLMKSARRSSRRSDRWLELDSIYTELRQIAADFDVPVWTASQANREGAKSAHGVRTYHVAGAMGKLNVADVALTISRPKRDVERELKAGGGHESKNDVDDIEGDEDMETNIRVWRLVKMRRGGEDGWRIDLRANYRRARFDVIDDNADIDSAMDAAYDGTQASWRNPNATD